MLSGTYWLFIVLGIWQMRGIFSSACGDKNMLVTGPYASRLVLLSMLPLILSRISCRCWSRGSNKKANQCRSNTGLFLTPPPPTGCPPSVSIHPICPGELSKQARSLVFPGVQLSASPGHLGSVRAGSIGSAPRSPRACRSRLEKRCFSFPCDFSIKYLLEVSFVYRFASAATFYLSPVFTLRGGVISSIYHTH